MKNRNSKWLWLLILPVLAILFYYLNPDKEKDKNWTEHYLNNSKDPFGTFAVFELLKDYNEKNSLESINTAIHKSDLEFSKDKPSTYVFIGSQLYLGEKDLDSLLHFVSEGNTAFISGKNFPVNLMDTLFRNVCSEWGGHYTHEDSVVIMNFEHEMLKDSLGYKFKTPVRKYNISRLYDWQGINGKFFCDSLIKTTSISSIKSDTSNYVNFIRYDYGKGYFLLHTTPIVFTNYYLLQPQGKEYANKVFSHFPEGKIYWDEYSDVPGSEGGPPAESPLKLILGNRSLKTAWYITLGLIAVYVVFFAKRKQRAIPILEQNINTSLEFIKTVGNLYFQQNQHRKLMRLKMRYFFSFIRQRYHLNTNKLDETLVKKLSQKSGITSEEIEKIFGQFNKINKYDVPVTVEDLIGLHNSLDLFYKNCK